MDLNETVTAFSSVCRFTRPQPQTSDYIEIAYLSVAFVLGAPLNLCAFTKLIERRNQHGLTRMLLLKLHICMTDLFVIFIYIAIQISTLMTYDWRGGPILCPFVTGYLKFVIFSSSSNVIVCIAIDRLLTVLFPRDHTGPTAFARVKWMLVVAWILAGLAALPQLFIFREFNPNSGDSEHILFFQCMTIWAAEKYKIYCSGGNQTSPSYRDAAQQEQYYNGAHTIVVFWLPLIIILTCYIYILCWACYHMGSGCSPYNQTRCEMVPATDLVDPQDLPPDFATATNMRKGTLPSTNQPANEPTVSSYPGNYNYTLTVTQYPGHGRYGHRYSSRSSAQFPALIRAKRKLLRSTLFIVFAYILCWVPYNVICLLQAFDTDTYETISTDVTFLYSFMVFNSVINPFLYGGVFSIGDCTCFKKTCVNWPRKWRRSDEKVIPSVKVHKMV